MTGGLYYPNTVTRSIWGSKTGTTLTSVDLTASYQAQSGFTTPTYALSAEGYVKMNLSILYTMGATETSNSIEIKVEQSTDGTNYYRIPNEAVSGGVSTLTAREFTFVGTNAAAATISIGLDVFYPFIKISGKETGKVTNFGTTYAEITLLGR